MEDTNDTMDDSVIDVSPTLIDIIDLTKESPSSVRCSRPCQRNAEDISSSDNVTSISDHHRRPISPIVLGNTQNTQTFVYTLLTS